MWTVSLRKAALKQLARVQEKERKQVWAALEAMRTNPMTGDVVSSSRGSVPASAGSSATGASSSISTTIRSSSTSWRSSDGQPRRTGDDERPPTIDAQS